MDFIKMRDRYRIYYLEEFVENSKAVIILTHGFAEYYSRYDYVSNYLQKNGFTIIRYDLRGHGRNEKRGHLDRFEDFIEDLREIVDIAIKKYPQTPIITLGHSMGGLITAIFGVAYPNKVDFQIFSGPALGVLPSSKKINHGLIKLLSKVAGSIMIKNPIDEGICGRREVYENYINDPYVLHKASVRMYYQFLFRGINIILKNMSDYRYKCLILHGELDPIVPAKISKKFYDSIASEKKHLKEYSGLYHEILNEDDRNIVLEDIITWINNGL